MRVYMERQSVSRQDDINAPNRRVIEVISKCRVRNFIEILMESYCPKVKSDRATWVLWDNHKVVAVFDSVSKKCKCFREDETFVKDIITKENPEMYLYYKGEDDINVVIEEYKEELIVS